MIATIGLIGGNNFRWKRVPNAVVAAAWRRDWLLEVGETQETLRAVLNGTILTEAEALRARYSDRSLVFARRNYPGQRAYVPEEGP